MRGVSGTLIWDRNVRKEGRAGECDGSVCVGVET